MKTILGAACAVVVMCGCSSSKKQEATVKPILQRPWIGGHYQTREVPESERTNENYKFGKHGALISTAHTNSPLVKAGLRETDLVLAVNGEKVRSEREIHKRAKKSGEKPATFTIYRDGEVLEKTVTPGTERYQKWNMIGFGLGFKPQMHFDFWPDPNFSLAVLGYHREPNRLDLQDAWSRFNAGERARSGKTEKDDGWIGQPSNEGYRFWLGPIMTERRLVIVSQE